MAGPILTYSPVLTDDDLAEIVRTRAMPYALAVAGRERLSDGSPTCSPIRRRPRSVAVLTGNPGAELSVATLRRIADDYGDDRTIQDRLIRRQALPYELVDRLLAALGDRLEWAVIRQRRIEKAEARRLIAAARDRAALSSVAREQEEIDRA